MTTTELKREDNLEESDFHVIIQGAFFYKKKCKFCGNGFLSAYKNTAICSDSCKKETGRSYYGFNQLRFTVLNRDNFKCVYCGRSPVNDNVILEVDHKIPRIKGGTNTLDNLVTACRDCNSGKTDVLLNN